MNPYALTYFKREWLGLTCDGASLLGVKNPPAHVCLQGKSISTFSSVCDCCF
jgi:hypothetical protein